MNDYMKLYDLWLSKTSDNAEIHSELESVAGNNDEILDRFYRNLEFGTAGLRGVLGAGTNRMNTYTVGQATQGLADYLNGKYERSSVAIGYDSRLKSDEFAKECACILAANGITAYIYPQLMPTPFVSFAVMELGCQSGIVITASHNPSKYNGYKCYDPKGYQMTEEAAAEVYGCIQKTDMFTGIKSADFDESVKAGLIKYIDNSVIEKFYSHCLDRPVNPDVIKRSDIKIYYSPLNGTGNIPVRTVLDRAGFRNISVIKEQELPDGHFPTCPYPNPEIRQVFDCGLEMCKKDPADLLLATDPDCDRVGIAVLTDGEYKLLTGNDVGVLLINYILSQRKAKGTLPETPVIIKSFVSTKLVDMVCAKYGAKLIDVLTGFKYIGEQVCELEAKGLGDSFILGFEESYGYLIGTHARDKDAVAASLMICEMAAYYKEQGQTLVDVLDSLYREFGYVANALHSYTFEGANGMKKMESIMSSARTNPPKALGDMKITEYYDYSTREVTNALTGEKSDTGLPESNILAYGLEGGNFAIMRPSGTEPKIKFYITGIGSDSKEAESAEAKLASEMEKLLK